MNYPRCKTCKWWGKQPHSDPEGFVEDPNVRFCTHAAFEGDGSPLSSGRVVTTGYYDGDGLATDPDFGCVHHEPTPTAK